MDDKLIPTLVLPGDEEEAQQAAAEAEAPVQEAAQPVQAAAAAVQTAPVEEAQQAPAQEEKKDEHCSRISGCGKKVSECSRKRRGSC